MIVPMPGWCVVRKVATEERYPGSGIIIPTQTRDRISQWQREVVAVGPNPICEDEDCERMHSAKAHVLHPRVQPGSWVLLTPRSTVEVPGDFSLELVSHDHLEVLLG